jgi:hypothetical protein
MYKYLLIFIAIQIATPVWSQNIGKNIDSLSIWQLALHGGKKDQLFLNMIEKRKSNNLYIHLDSLKFEYAIIVETFCQVKKEYTLNEYYFKANDTVPYTLYFNSTPYHPENYFDRTYSYYFELTRYQETLNPMLELFDTLHTFQTLTYDRNIIVNSGCVVDSKREDKDARNQIKARTKSLETTYQILTLIDIAHNRNIVSFQIPPKNFSFEIIRYNAVWDF